MKNILNKYLFIWWWLPCRRFRREEDGILQYGDTRPRLKTVGETVNDSVQYLFLACDCRYPQLTSAFTANDSHTPYSIEVVEAPK